MPWTVERDDAIAIRQPGAKRHHRVGVAAGSPVQEHDGGERPPLRRPRLHIVKTPSGDLDEASRRRVMRLDAALDDPRGESARQQQKGYAGKGRDENLHA